MATKEERLKTLIKEEIGNIIGEDKISPSSEEDWDLVRQAAEPYIMVLLSKFSRIVSDEADSFEDTLSHHYNMNLENPKEFLYKAFYEHLGYKK